MKIYRFRSHLGNYRDGYWYFASDSQEEAIDIAKKFETDYNIDKNENYIIHFEDTPLEFEVKKGYIPMNVEVETDRIIR